MRRTGYEFYLKKCLLPVTPQRLNIRINNANTTLTLINDGEINLLKTAKLTDIDFSCDIPQVYLPYALYKFGFEDASYFLDYFEELKTSKAPFQFIVSRAMPSGIALFSTNIKVSLEDYRLTEQARNGFCISVHIKLKQYREYGTQTVNIDTSTSTATIQKTRTAETSPAPKSQQTYTVKQGDCLWNISKKYYGDGSKYGKIQSANAEITNPNQLYVGQKLIIPAM